MCPNPPDDSRDDLSLPFSPESEELSFPVEEKPSSFSEKGSSEAKKADSFSFDEARKQEASRAQQGEKKPSRLEILKKIGSGGMGDVYLARDSALGRLIALKRLKGALIKTAKGRARFLREAQAMARIEHPNVVCVYRAEEDEIGPYIEMEYIEGRSLREEVLAAGAGLSPDRVIEMGITLCGALAAAHSRGILHRDVKPGNVLLTNEGVPKLTDFGLAAADREENPLDSSLTGTGVMLGTPYYAPPEQVRDAKSADARSDVYSLGATLYFASTGEEPRVIRLEKVPAGIRSVLEKALEERREDRFSNAGEFALALENIRGILSAPKQEPERGPRAPGSGTAAPLLEAMIAFDELEAAMAKKNTPAEERVAYYKTFERDYSGTPEAEEARERAARLKVEEAKKKADETQTTAAKMDYGTLYALMPPKTEEEGKKRRDMWLAYIRRHESSGYRLEYAQQQAKAAPRIGHEAEQASRAEAHRRRRVGVISVSIIIVIAVSVWSVKLKHRTGILSPVLSRAETFDLGGGVNLEMVYLEGGTFQMGSPDSEEKRGNDEGPVHEVELDGFWIGKYEVTQEQYQAITGTNPSYFTGAKNPVECVSWNNATMFCLKLIQKTGRTFRLPTEAEWEYACRAGSRTRYCSGDWSNDLRDYAWYDSNSGRQTHPVGQKKPNAWGLYDMHGNVWEWCKDRYQEDYYRFSPRYDPIGPSSDPLRVLRGGNWRLAPWYCRSADRGGLDSADTRGVNGFRVVCVSGGL